MPTVLAILAEGFEEIETVAPVDLLRRAGAEVTLASLAPQIETKGRCGMVIHADTLLDNVAGKNFDLLFLPGGPGVSHLRSDPRVREIVLRHARNGAWITAICAAPTVLQDAGLLAGRRYTAHFSVASELRSIIEDAPVVIDGKFITSRGAGTAIEFGLTLVSKLMSLQKAQEIARSVCFESLGAGQPVQWG